MIDHEQVAALDDAITDWLRLHRMQSKASMSCDMRNSLARFLMLRGFRRPAAMPPDEFRDFLEWRERRIEGEQNG